MHFRSLVQLDKTAKFSKICIFRKQIKTLGQMKHAIETFIIKRFRIVVEGKIGTRDKKRKKKSFKDLGSIFSSWINNSTRIRSCHRKVDECAGVRVNVCWLCVKKCEELFC